MHFFNSLNSQHSYSIKNITVKQFTVMLLLFVLAISSPSVSAQSKSGYAIFTLEQGFKKLSKSKARMLYKGKVKRLQGKMIELSDWPTNHSYRNDFYQHLLGKDKAQMNAHWASLSFSGKARPPKEINQESVDALVQWLKADSNRIGYAPISAIPNNANVLYVVPNS